MKRLAVLAVIAATLAVWVAVVYPVGYSGRGSKAEVDGVTNAIRVMEYEHHEIHSGSSFNVDYSETTASSDDDRTAIGLITPDTTRWAHLTITVSSTGAAEFFFLEAPTTDTEGTDLAIKNRNRNSGVASTILNIESEAAKVSTYDETAVAALNLSGGTQLEYMLMGGGVGARAIGGASRGAREWVLKQDTKYIFMIQNVGASANTHVISLSWYEHSDR